MFCNEPRSIYIYANYCGFLGLVIENERDDRKLEKLSLRKQLRLKSQEHQAVNPVGDTPMETNSNANKHMAMPTHTHFSPSMNLNTLF